jgi:hypothetical protein
MNAGPLPRSDLSVGKGSLPAPLDALLFSFEPMELPGRNVPAPHTLRNSLGLPGLTSPDRSLRPSLSCEHEKSAYPHRHDLPLSAFHSLPPLDTI